MPKTTTNKTTEPDDLEKALREPDDIEPATSSLLRLVSCQSIEVARLRDQVAALEAWRDAMAEEVRTRSLVVVDANGAHRFEVRVRDSHTAVEVIAPRRADGEQHARVSLEAVEGELCDEAQRPIACSSVTVSAKDEVGVEVRAEEWDGRPWRPVEQQDRVRAAVVAYDREGAGGSGRTACLEVPQPISPP